MKRIITPVVLIIIAVLIIIGIFIITTKKETQSVNPIIPALTAKEAELSAFNFILNLIAAAPPKNNPEAISKIFNSLSTAAQAKIHKETLFADLAKFAEIKDVPDKGASVEDLKIISPTESILIVGLNYSSGRVIKNIYLVAENGDWKVDRVTPATENLVKNNPGL